MRSKQVGIFLLIGSAYQILLSLYATMNRFIGESASYFKDHPVQNVLYTLEVIFPIGLLLLAVHLISRDQAPTHSETRESAEQRDPSFPMSVADWVISILVTLIPLVGLIFLIIWANDHRNVIKRNWSIAMLIWGGIFTAVSFLFYLAILGAAGSGL